MGCCSGKPAEPEPRLSDWLATLPPPIQVVGTDALSGNTIATVEVPTYWKVRELKEELMEHMALNPELVFIDITCEGKLLKNSDTVKAVFPCEEPTSPAVVLITTMPLPSGIPHGVDLPEKKPPGGSGGMWSGIAESGGRLFLAPHHADCVLVIDPAAGTTSTIPIVVADGMTAWEQGRLLLIDDLEPSATARGG